MKLAVVSGAGSQSGKTALAILLSNLYCKVQNKTASLFTTKSASELLSYLETTESGVGVSKSVNVMMTLITSNKITDERIEDYSYRGKNIDFNIYDTYSETSKTEETLDKFKFVVNKVKDPLIVIDVCGDFRKGVNKEVVDICDAILYVCTPSKKDFKMFAEYYNSLSEDEKLKVKLVINKYDNRGVRLKDMLKMVKMQQSNVIIVPYCFNVERAMFEGRLCTLNNFIYDGTESTAMLRLPLYRMLSYMFDTRSLKVIKEVSKWE